MLLLSAQTGWSQQKDSAECVTPSLPFFPFSSAGEPEGLKKITSAYYHDGKDVYLKYTRDVGSARAVVVTSYHKIEGAIIEGFKDYEGTWFARDNHSVFYRGFKVQDADVETFEPLNLSYAKDKNNVYFKCCKIKEADRNTFVAINNGGYYDFAYDKNLLYFYKERIAIDSATFSVDNIEDKKIFHNRCRDKDYVYNMAGTSFDGYIIKQNKGDLIKETLRGKDGNKWSSRPYKVEVKAKDEKTEKELQEKIYADFTESIKSKYITFASGYYKLKGSKMRFYYNGYEKEFDVEPSAGNYILVKEDVTEEYKEVYPDAGITRVLLVIGMYYPG